MMHKDIKSDLVAVIAAALVAGAAGTAAHAQEQTRPITIRLSGEAEHHSNAARATAAQAALRGLKRSDEIYRPSIDIAVNKTFGVVGVVLDASAAYDFYAHNTQLNRERLGLGGTISANLSRCRLDLMPSYSRRQTDLGDIAFLTGVGDNSVVNVETVKAIHGSARCGGAVGLAPVVSAGYETGDNSNGLRKVSDYRATDYGVGIAYSQPTFGDLTLKGDVRELTYPNRPRFGGREDGFKQKTASATFSRAIGANLRGTVMVGYTWLDPRAPNVASFDGLTWSADVTATFADRLQISALVSRSASPTLQSNAAYMVNRDIGLNAKFALTDQFSLSAGYQNSRRRYEGVLATTPALRRADANTYSASLDYQFNDRLRFGIFGRYLKRDSDQALFDYDDEVLGARVGFQL